jgi:microcystin-dependent protein
MINFPSTFGQPTDGTFKHTEAGQTWAWNGVTWKTAGGGGSEYILPVATSSELGGILSTPNPGGQFVTGVATSGELVFGESLPAATILFCATLGAPTGFLKCNGAAISRTTYSRLFAALGTFYGAGDGSSTFNIPDLRGEFLRVIDEGRGLDANRTLGSVQAQAIQSHAHSGIPTQGQNDVVGYLAYQTSANVNNYNGNLPSSGGGAETRPRNIALQAIIKY